MATTQQVGDGNLDQTLLVGRSGMPVQIGSTITTTLGFYGTTPAAQPTSSNEAAVNTSPAVSVSATQWGFTTSTQANALVTLVNQMRADLVTLGLIKGS